MFICPILSGSGVRVKLLEAFAYGLPVVSTQVGAEGLASSDCEYCRLADGAEDFANAVEELLKDRATAAEMGKRAHDYVQRDWDAKQVIARLAEEYRQLLKQKTT